MNEILSPDSGWWSRSSSPAETMSMNLFIPFGLSLARVNSFPMETFAPRPMWYKAGETTKRASSSEAKGLENGGTATTAPFSIRSMLPPALVRSVLFIYDHWGASALAIGHWHWENVVERQRAIKSFKWFPWHFIICRSERPKPQIAHRGIFACGRCP